MTFNDVLALLKSAQLFKVRTRHHALPHVEPPVAHCRRKFDARAG
jgi:hypothetical protein